MSRIFSAIGRHLADRAKAIVPEVAQTLQAKAAQGANELSNAIFTGQAYMPWPGTQQQTVNQQATRAVDVQEEMARITHDRAAARAESPLATPQRQHSGPYAAPDSAHRAQFQQAEQSKGIER